MSKVKVKLDSKGIISTLKSESMLALVVEEANKIQGRCGTGFEVLSGKGKTRAQALVRPATVKAKKKNRKENILLKAVKG